MIQKQIELVRALVYGIRDFKFISPGPCYGITAHLVGVIKSMGHAPQMLQFENWNLIITPEILGMPQSRSFYSYILLFQKGGG